MGKDVTLRDYRESDAEAIFTLMGEIYDADVVANSRRHWRWQYHENPRNPEGRVPIRVVDRDGEVVATICGIRQDFSIAGLVSTGRWVVDFMARQAGTNERERLRFGQRLAFELRDTQPLVAGVNRPALNRYWKRVLGDQVDICAVPMMVRPLRTRRLARRRVRNPALAAGFAAAARAALPVVYRVKRRAAPDGVTFDPIDRFDSRFDQFWKGVAPSFTNLAVRDSIYLNWRYRGIPDRTYECFVACRAGEVRGWVVVRLLRDGDLLKGRIVDVLARSDDLPMWYFLIGSAVSRLADQGADLVHGLGSTVAAVREAYRECGFRPNPEHARTSQYIAYNNLEGIDQDAFYNGDNWYVTLGDSDTDFARPE